jgi:hypothetical protein
MIITLVDKHNYRNKNSILYNEANKEKGYYSALRLHSNSYAQKLCILHNFAREKLGFSETFAHKKHLSSIDN